MMDPRRKSELETQINFYNDAINALEGDLWDHESPSPEEVDTYKSYATKRIQELEMELEGI